MFAESETQELWNRVIYLEAIVQRLSEEFNAHTHTYNPTLTSTSVATSVPPAEFLVDSDFTLNRLP
jgi:hypothetical protein